MSPSTAAGPGIFQLSLPARLVGWVVCRLACPSNKDTRRLLEDSPHLLDVYLLLLLADHGCGALFHGGYHLHVEPNLGLRHERAEYFWKTAMEDVYEARRPPDSTEAYHAAQIWRLQQ